MKSLKVDIDKIIKEVSSIASSLELTKKGSSGITGHYDSRYIGIEGMEFFDFRKYTSSDDPISVDWKASLRTGQLLVRETVIEKNPEVIIMLDCGSSMLYSSSDKLKIEYAIELLAGLSYLLLSLRVSVGLILYSDKVKRVIGPKSGKRHFNKLRKILVNHSFFGGKRDFNVAFSAINSIASADSIVVMLSDFIGFSNKDRDFIKRVGYKYNLIGLMLRDIRDKEIPAKGYVNFEDPHSKKQLLINTNKIYKKYNEESAKEERQVCSIFVDSSSKIHKLYTNEKIKENLRKVISGNVGV